MSKASKTIRVSESLHEQITAHNREDETLNETLEGLVGGPSPASSLGRFQTTRPRRFGRQSRTVTTSTPTNLPSSSTTPN